MKTILIEILRGLVIGLLSIFFYAMIMSHIKRDGICLQTRLTQVYELPQDKEEYQEIYNGKFSKFGRYKYGMVEVESDEVLNNRTVKQIGIGRTFDESNQMRRVTFFAEECPIF